MSKQTAMDTETASIIETSKTHPCECQKWSIEHWTGEVPEGADPGEYVEYKTTGCISDTTRVFAPGHDAKLKSLMIKAGADGDAMRMDDGGMAHIGDPTTMAARFGFEFQVGAGILRAKEKAAARAAKKAAKAAAKANKEATKAVVKKTKDGIAERQATEAGSSAEPVTIKVGRWKYAAKINPADNSAEYTSANGETKTVAAGKFQIVTA